MFWSRLGLLGLFVLLIAERRVYVLRQRRFGIPAPRGTLSGGDLGVERRYWPLLPNSGLWYSSDVLCF